MSQARSTAAATAVTARSFPLHAGIATVVTTDRVAPRMVRIMLGGDVG
jgi:NADPH-dependent ferric siderophore reductase